MLYYRAFLAWLRMPARAEAVAVNRYGTASAGLEQDAMDRMFDAARRMLATFG